MRFFDARNLRTHMGVREIRVRIEVARAKFAHAGELTVKPANEPDVFEMKNALRPRTITENKRTVASGRNQ